jgi:hypothetical protein
MVLGSLGLVLFLSGMVVFPLPIPFGLLMMALGLTNSNWAPELVRRARRRWPKFDGWLRQAGRKMPRSMFRVLAATDPRRKPRGIRP